MRILVVEDNQTNLKVILGMLKRLGYEATTVENGRDALSTLETQEFDLVLLDLQMPIMNGFDTARAIRQLENTNRDVIIIALSADTSIETVDRCMESGMNAHLPKPIRLGVLDETLQQYKFA